MNNGKVVVRIFKHGMGVAYEMLSAPKGTHFFAGFAGSVAGAKRMAMDRCLGLRVEFEAAEAA